MATIRNLEFEENTKMLQVHPDKYDSGGLRPVYTANKSCQQNRQQNIKGKELNLAKETKQICSVVSLTLFNTLPLVFCCLFCCACSIGFVCRVYRP